MSLSDPKVSNPAADSSGTTPPDQKVSLKEQIQHTQQKLQKLENQLQAEENVDNMRNMYQDSMHQGRLARSVEDSISKLEERDQMYKNIHYFLQEIRTMNQPIQHERFTQRNIEALRDLKVMMDMDEKAMRENYPFEIYYNLHNMRIRSGYKER
ncbi:hypothetical protein NpPPO83_00011513 [Neofusicoccum parvum]|uniref:Uncharacterized protein n=1 Tax=Neofusicoccum parvum TaxID=310453 RepID=A0ACB5S2D6_9PEZI|nr:hypothetical protein NpPPO83_00011513 [Neofusicoccum parvum]